ncbi:hypothetical protein HRR83_001107 [Exophiala dermatitidis]|uniref:FAD-binding PCMH-type domain-containing protein n=2 Tax=Exophiala dermatitidis TaxID=5970 RepID=H6C7C5_EXODN|nr:uncharacterized protein HMPREF1120_07606 [Exophiala dermatitidis NIH/UT8656]KAJ4522617.1 hypothetical protein HRR75_001011 [Exophiala dermatitidis]EHY59621.1 hypothetical protein HMPREF1120_07606 [Exophiala dermatitidis NIH/UT8656]KAJ4525918.1 hypothetical protein HRR74_001111 [Exophiala dermatitidis]KAJ4527135.1 hypothetical protein HRR73_001932 [Exophiala dermatitidis]KAJ4532856.1 hypothetical protein HRR76_007833 [Exophiala dermatitidis]
MATSQGPYDGPTSVTDCILGLKKNIDSKKLPGFVELIDDWFDPDTQVDEEQFVRRFLRVFKVSDQDFTYERIIGDYDEGLQNIFNDFVDGKLNAQEAAEKYRPYTMQNLPKKLGTFRKNRKLSSIIPGERNVLEEHTALLAALPTSIPSRIRAFIAKLVPALKFPTRFLYVPSFKDLEFQNWGRTVTTTPTYTCVPSTARDVVDIVRYAKKHKMGVRVAGFRHSWSPVFGRSNANSKDAKTKSKGDILISSLGLVDASVLPNFTSLPGDIFEPRAKDLNSILVVDHNYVKGPKLSDGKKYVRVGTSTTNEQFRRWCIDTGNVTLPMNIIEVEITMGGANATICHGAGINNPTLSDLVRCIEYVDANGKLGRVDLSTPDILHAAAGCFGLIGVVTHLVLECDPMSCALLEPRKIPVIEAIPPPPDMPDADIPAPLRPRQPLSAERKAQIQRDFETRALTTDYAEWFWFPYSSEVWVNSWHKTSDLSNAVTYPSDAKTILQVLGTIMMNIAQNADTLLDTTEFLPATQTKLLTWLAMKNLDDIGPNGKKIKARLPDALHFQRGVQNIRVRDLEVEFPLQPRKQPSTLTPMTPIVNGTAAMNGNATLKGQGYNDAQTTTESHTTTTDRLTQVDLSLVQRAWWDAIIACYNAIYEAPQRMPLEMRIMSSSEVTLAPQRGHTLGTCSIEILTLHDAADIWKPYAQTVLDKWSNYRDANGDLVPVRPHWAKEWYGHTVRGRQWEQLLRSESSRNGGFRDEIAEWRSLVERLAVRDGWTVGDARFRFGNEVLDRLFWQDEDKDDLENEGGAGAVVNGNGTANAAAGKGPVPNGVRRTLSKKATLKTRTSGRR